MCVRHAAAASQQRAHIAARLRLMQLPERQAHAGNGKIVTAIRRDDQEQAGVGTAFVELARRMEIAWPDAERRHAAKLASPGGAQSSQLDEHVLRRRQIGKNRNVVARARGTPQLGSR